MDTTVKNTEVNSVPAWGMTTQTNATKIYGSADDQAHLRHVKGPKGQLGLLDFTEWNAVAPTSPPLANQLVKIPGLEPLCWNLSAGLYRLCCRLWTSGPVSPRQRRPVWDMLGRYPTDQGEQMTATGDFPAPGPQDREVSADRPTSAPSAASAMSRPQTPMLTAHKPGILPLRPLQLGDILDGAVKAIRFNPKSMVGLSAIVLAVFLIPSAALAVGVTHLSATSLSRYGTGAEAFVGLPAVLLQNLSTTFATAILSGLLIHVVGQAVLGRKPGIEQTWRTTRGRVPALFGVMILALLVTVLSTTLLIGPGVLLLVNNNLVAGMILLLLGTLGLIAFSLFFSTKISMAAPAIVLEGHGVLAGLRRSFALTKGSAFWRILGITLLAGLLAAIAGAILGLPFSFINLTITALSGQNSEFGQMIVTFVSHLSALLTGAITTPFVAAVTGLLYIDRRMRLEALDVVLIRESLSNPAPPL